LRAGHDADERVRDEGSFLIGPEVLAWGKIKPGEFGALEIYGTVKGRDGSYGARFSTRQIGWSDRTGKTSSPIIEDHSIMTMRVKGSRESDDRFFTAGPSIRL